MSGLEYGVISAVVVVVVVVEVVNKVSMSCEEK